MPLTAPNTARRDRDTHLLLPPPAPRRRPPKKQGDPNTMRLIEHGSRNRLATVLWYLSDVAEANPTSINRSARVLFEKTQRQKDCNPFLTLQQSIALL